MILDQSKIAVSTGTASTASNSDPVDHIGFLEALHFSWDVAVVTKTVSVVVKTLGTNGPPQTLFSTSLASNASGWYYPRTPTHTSAGVVASYAAGSAVLTPFAVYDRLVFSVDGSDTGLAGSPYKMTAFWRK